ncbi:MAG: single-stranded-DNA-specific exonuclease RecJ, partial [Terriglobales bacterium]
DENLARNLAAEAGLPALVARLLVARGITLAEDAHRFLNPSLDHLHSPYEMLGMDKAIERLRRAIAANEKILIYGDYDVDGTTAVVILKTAIELCGGRADFHVPHRIREGYGMKDDVIERAQADGVTLLISVDTGIRAFAAAETARRLNLDLIVTDHHLPDDAHGIPPALAVLNPNQRDCSYPCKALCGAGVAFKVAQALLETTAGAPHKPGVGLCGTANTDPKRLISSFLKIVAIATIADAVPLVGENRVFAKLGLDGLRHPVNAGLKALLEVAQLGVKPAGAPGKPGVGLPGFSITAGDVAFRIAPRLNAAGRMDVAQDVVELFSVKDPVRAREIAARLNQLNADRQEEERRILDRVAERFRGAPDMADAYCIVVDGDGWHRGVIGIAATRVVEKYGRPALVLSNEDGEAYGSGRSISAFHLLDALESCREMFTRFGGHAHAVGFSLPCDRVPDLRAALDQYARARLTPADFIPVLNYDGDVSLFDINDQLYDTLTKLEPFGMGNPEPVFAAAGTRVMVPPRILKEKHLRLKLAQPNGTRYPKSWNAVGWRMAEHAEGLLAGDSVDAAFTLEHNDHPDFGGLELRLCDVRKSVAAQAG